MKQDEVKSPLTKSPSSDSIPLSLRRKRKRSATVASLYDSAETRSRVMREAMEIEANLQKTHHQYPTLIKVLMPSHTATRFKMCLLKEFCDRHLPLADKKMGLKVGDGRVYPVNYLWRVHSICGGWRAFAVYHGLEAGDVLVFQLVNPLNFKVYIVRANGSKEVDAVNPEAAETSVAESEENNDTNSVMDDDDDVYIVRANSSNKADVVRPRKLFDDLPDAGTSVVEFEENNTSNSFMADDDDGDEIGFELDMGYESGSESNIELPRSNADDFERVRFFEEFKIVANGAVINGKLTELLRFKYYQLCLSQRSFLHRGLLEGLNVRIISGMIADICDIADAIRGMSKVVLKKDLETWGSKLKGFEKLGMSVEFLLVRLGKLEWLADKAHGYERLMKERRGMKEELQNLEQQVGRVKQKLELVDKEIDKLGVAGSGSIDRDFLELANAPW